jgi:hypothetical protein
MTTRSIRPSFYQWQKTFFENGAAAFERSPHSRRVDLGNVKVEQLEARLKKKDEVIAAVTGMMRCIR